MLALPPDQALPNVASPQPDVADLVTHDPTELLAIVGHEMGTLLTVVKSNVRLLRQSLEFRCNWPNEVSLGADDAEFAIERMSSLREHLLAASRREPLQVELEPIHLERCLRRACRWAQAPARDRGIELTEEYGAEAPYAMANEWAVQSIATNLLSNAVRYTLGGGRVHMRTHNADSDLIFEVSDTGIGIAEWDLANVFERWYGAPDARRTTAAGLGLGLAITREFVLALGGTIEAKSEVGIGTTFKVALPKLTPDSSLD